VLTRWRRASKWPQPDPRWAIVLAQSTRAVEGQQQSLDALHARIGVLLSAATIATSFLGGIAFDRPELGWAGGIAVVLFGLHVWLCLSILRTKTWTFQVSASVLIDSWIGRSQVDVNQLQRALARKLDGYHAENEVQLRRLWGLYGWAILVLGGEVGMWLAELWGVERWICELVCR
jgi:hypothetical protein